MKNMRTPRFLENLYRDMRDRRLLLPALALLVAADRGAVRCSELVVQPSAVGPRRGHERRRRETAVEPAVLTEQVGITDYRKRLDSLQSKDPFRSQCIGAAQERQVGPSTSSTRPSSTTTGGHQLERHDLILRRFRLRQLHGHLATTTTTPSTGSGSGNSTAPLPRKHRPPILYSFRVSVAVGPAGDLTDRDNVKRTGIPPRREPAVGCLHRRQRGREARDLRRLQRRQRRARRRSVLP